MGGAYPRLFDGVDFKKFNGATFFPVLVAEKEAQHKQIKILLIREYDLSPSSIPDMQENVLVRTASKQYKYVPDHPHLLRWRTTKSIIDRLNNDSDFAEGIATQVGLPFAIKTATPEARKKAGIMPPLKLVA
jgi:hypothetical protein